MNRDTPELLKCPCCGGPPQYASGITGVRVQVYVYCCHCGMRTEIAETYEAVAAWWNKRALNAPAFREASDTRARLAAADAFNGALLREMVQLRRERDLYRDRLRGANEFRMIAARLGVEQDTIRARFLEWLTARDAWGSSARETRAKIVSYVRSVNERRFGAPRRSPEDSACYTAIDFVCDEIERGDYDKESG